jgi:GNAT superfamily N-acetyltransferase
MPDMVSPSVKDPGDTVDPTSRLAVGHRVSVRYRLPEGAEAGATDAVGVLVDRDEEHLHIDARAGRVTVRRGDVIAAKEVPPAPTRPGPAHARISADDLELLMEQAWPAVDRQGLGSWVLRSSSGFTGRACSALPVGDPTLPLDRAVDYVENWYAERAQPPMFQLHGPEGFRVEDGELGAVLLERGYAVGGGRPDWARVLVLTAPSAAVPPLTESSVPVVADARMSPEWLMAYGQSRTVVPGVTEAVLTGREGLLFLSVRDEASGRIVAIARMAIHPGWAGVFAVWVHPEHRRRGIATAMTSAVAMVARENAMPSMYLQVSADNAAGIRLYEDLGFTVHHEYTYLKRPSA